MATTYEEHLAMMKLMMQDMIQINKDNMSQLVGAMHKSEYHHEDKFDKLCKPHQFRGEESKYHEWVVKYLAYSRSKIAASDGWCTWAMNSDVAITDERIKTKYEAGFDLEPTRVSDFSRKLHTNLINLCEGEAFKIVQSVPTGNGLEGLRLLKKRYDPHTPGSKRALLKTLMNLPSCKKIGEVESMILKL